MLLTALSILTLGACQRIVEDDLAGGVGDEICFDILTGKTPTTRTTFSGELVGGSNPYERIDWVDGDRFKVFCAEVSSPSDKLAEFTVKNHSASGQNSVAGVWTNKSFRWGEGEHVFYALYPSPESASNATMDATKPNIVGGIIPSAITLTKNAETGNYFTDMKYAYMYAVTKASPGIATVPLEFKPLMTAFEFSLLNSSTDPITSKLTKVTLTSAQEDSWLAGNFTAELKPDGSYELAVTNNTNRKNEIAATISGGVLLSAETPLKITLLGLPMTQSKLSITLTFEDRTRTRTLKVDVDGDGTVSENEWVVVDAGHKLSVQNEAVPGLWKYTLEHADATIEQVTLVDADHTVARVLTKSGAAAGNAPVAKYNSYKSTNDGATKTLVSQTFEYALADEHGDPVMMDGHIAWQAWDGTVASLPEGMTKLAFSTSGTTISMTPTASANSSPIIESVNCEMLDHARVLKAKTPIANDKDLSLYAIENLDTPRSSGLPTTANCYVVDRPGTYRFPLVYGNAVDFTREGAPLYAYGVNQYSYKDAETPVANVSNLFHNFQRYDATSLTGGLITSPYILDDLGLTTDDVNAVIVWQDVPAPDGGRDYSIVKDVSVVNVTSNMYYDVDGAQKTSVPYIQFEVPAGEIDEDVTVDPLYRVTGIRQGNALIALRNSDGKILWSWHIWITDEPMTPVNVLTRGTSVVASNDMMPVNLGWCDNNTTLNYRDRVWYVRVTQTESRYDDEPISLVYKIVQTTASAKPSVSSGTYYQWGRKDPFLPSIGNAALNKGAYSPAGFALVSATNKVNFSKTVSAGAAYSIQNPYVQYYNNSTAANGGYGWMATSVYPNNLWNMANGASSAQDISVSKTVYDPCPPGYCIPHKTAFTYFTSNGGSVTSVNNLIVVDKNSFTDPETSENGWAFNTGGDSSIFFPVPGYRNVTDGALSAINSSGYAWTASPNANNTAFYLSYAATSANPVYSGARAHALSVRAVKEKPVE